MIFFACAYLSASKISKLLINKNKAKGNIDVSGMIADRNVYILIPNIKAAPIAAPAVPAIFANGTNMAVKAGELTRPAPYVNNIMGTITVGAVTILNSAKINIDKAPTVMQIPPKKIILRIPK